MSRGREQVQGFHLSPQQRRLWRLGAGDDGARWRLRATVRTDGLDAGAVEAALAAVVAEREILRTRFESLPGMELPLQVVGEPDADGPHGDGGGDGPPLRFAWTDGARGERLQVDASPLCVDRTGLRRLLDRVATLAASGGADGDAPGLQYADLAAWQNELLEADETEEGRKYWQRRPLPPRDPFHLPCRHPDDGGAFDPAARSHTLSPAAADALVTLGEHADADPEAVLLAVWTVVLARWSGGFDHATVAVASDGRRYQELEDVVGPLERYLPLAPGLDGATPLAEAVRRTAGALTEARRWQEAFDWPAAEGDGAPWLPWGFAAEPAPADSPLVIEESFDPRERCELRLAWRHGGDRLELTWDRRCYREDDVAELLGGVEAVLTAGAGTPATRLDLLPLLGDDQVRAAAGSADADPPAAERPVHERVVEAAARRPDAVAVSHAGGGVTYRELAQRSAALARRLRGAGVGAEDRVLLLAGRSPLTVLGLLGVLRAGAAYLPLEPGQPVDRLRTLLDEAGPRLVLSEGDALPGRLTAELGVPVWDLEEATAADGEAGDTAVAGVEVDPANLAYVLFTSGSTGRPKAVAVEHRQLTFYTAAVGRRLDLPEHPALAAVTTLAADLAHTMVFPALTGGGRLHLVAEDTARDPEALAAELAAAEVDGLKMVPSHLEAVLAGAEAADLLPRGVLVLGGEATHRDLLATLRAAAGEAAGDGPRIVNHYGPTETTVGALTLDLDRPWDGRWGSAPIGHPLPGARARVLDGAGRPLPHWVAGEIHLGGGGVARGYLGRPAATAAAFLPDPHAGEPGARAYRTGDLGRRLPDAGIEFLGRADHQVKIRGHRVELGEIETRLREHRSVREAAVLLRGRGAGAGLAAYVVPTEDGVQAGELREWLQGRLPEVMVPAAWALLKSLPVTANGKLDRRALAEVEPQVGEGSGDAPRNEVEQVLATVWSELLGVERIGPGDSFFALGGHSLLATRVVSRVRERFGVELPLAEVFERPTLEELAATVEEALRSGAGVDAPPLEPVPRDGDAPLGYSQLRHWFLHRMEEENGALYNIRGAVRLEGRLDAGAVEGALGRVMARHEVLRTSFPEVDGGPVQRVHDALPVPLRRVDLTALPEGERMAAARHEIRRQGRQPFVLTEAPLLRAVLLRLAADDHVLSLTVHHIVADGWSLQVLVGELVEVYGALVRGREPDLEPLPVQYADFAAWQRSWLQGEALEIHLDHWRRVLDGADPEIGLPYDFPPPESPGRESARAELKLSPEVGESLLRQARQAGASPFQLLLAAYAALLGDVGGRSDLTIGAPVANRNRLRLESLIGCFINVLALRVDLAGDPPFAELVEQVRRRVLEASAHQDLPFEKLVDELNPQRQGGDPLLSTVFAFGDRSTSMEPPPGLRLTPLATDSGFEAKYPLFLVMSDLGDALSGALVYSRDRFTAATADALAARFSALLAEVAERPEAPLSELTGAARRQAREAQRQRTRERRRGSLEGLRRRRAAEVAE